MNILNITRIGDELYLDAYLVRDICKASIIPREQVKNGEPDVVIKSLIRDYDRIGRAELVNRFRHVNGNKIHVNAWKRGKANLVMPYQNDKEVYRAFYVPKGIQVCIDSDGSNRIVTGGNYVVFDNDTYTIAVIPKSMFLKMFKLCGQIERISQYKPTEFSFNSDKEDNLFSDKVSLDKEEPKSKLNLSKDNTNTDETNTNWEGLNTEEDYSDSSELEDSETRYRYTAIGKILGEDGKIKGFVIKDNLGQISSVDKRTINRLAVNKEIDNVGVKLKDGKPYIYGKERPLGELPTMG